MYTYIAELADDRLCCRCRAPIASLDCMEEFNGGAGTDSSGHYGSTPGTKEHLLASCLAAQSQRLNQHNPSPGIRYRNLGKSGLRVSNVGLGTLYMFLTTTFMLMGAYRILMQYIYT